MPKITLHLLAALLLLTALGCAAPIGPLKDDPWPQDGLHDQATPVALDQEVRDRVGPDKQDKRDWKSFQLQQPQTLRVWLRLLTNERQVSVHVYKANGELLGTLLGQAGAEQNLTLQGHSGIYYVEVVSEEEQVIVDYGLLIESL